MQLTQNFNQNIQYLDQCFHIDKNFDLPRRNIVLGGKRAAFYFVDGFLKDEVFEKMLEFLLKITPEQMAETVDADAFLKKFISYAEAELSGESERVVTAVLSGMLALAVEGYAQVILLDLRTYPLRSIAEPEDDHVLRGPRDGFCETLVFNTALLRRRIRDAKLCVELQTAGKRSKTDIAICYLSDLADQKLLREIKQRIAAIDLNALPLSQQSLAEQLHKKGMWNPFPKIKFTERPDTAAASVLEGRILVMVDNSPSVLILPTTIFDFAQEANDFYFPPLIGTYLRVVRLAVFLLSLVLTPIWYLLVKNPQMIPPGLSFLALEEPPQVPVFVQLLLVELIVDGLKLAALNTPTMLASSFSVVGALILGQFAVEVGVLSADVILFMAFVAIANFTQPSFELGYAFKLLRLFLLTLIALFDVWGFWLGLAGIFVLLLTNKTVSKTSYLYPLIPFNGRKLKDALLRTKADAKNN